MKTLQKHRKFYNDILTKLEENKDLHLFDIDDLRNKSRCHLFEIELREKYGLNINPGYISNLDYIQISEHLTICRYGEKYHRTISWPDDGKQPGDETLLVIDFPTGPFIFGDDYPKKLFQEFFNELKSYGPKYIDSHNNSLYFTLDNAKDIFNNFTDILKKYYEINKVDRKNRQIQKLKQDLETLEND